MDAPYVPSLTLMVHQTHIYHFAYDAHLQLPPEITTASGKFVRNPGKSPRLRQPALYTVSIVTRKRGLPFRIELRQMNANVHGALLAICSALFVYWLGCGWQISIFRARNFQFMLLVYNDCRKRGQTFQYKSFHSTNVTVF